MKPLITGLGIHGHLSPQTVFSSIDHTGRYAFSNQPIIAQWNLARLAETLLPLLDKKVDNAIEIAKETINSFNQSYNVKMAGNDAAQN